MCTLTDDTEKWKSEPTLNLSISEARSIYFYIMDYIDNNYDSTDDFVDNRLLKKLEYFLTNN